MKKIYNLKLKDQDNNTTTRVVKTDNITEVMFDLINTRIYKEVKYGKN